MKIRENLGGIISSISNATPSTTTKSQVGKIFGVITTENTPTKELFERSGGWSAIGTIFYLPYEQSKNLDNIDLNICKVAKPLHTNNQNYPLIGELVILMDLPSPISQINNSSTQKYYSDTINLWNNNQQNSPSTEYLGKTFIEKANIRNLVSFEGDRIYQGRKGNGIRFGSTVKSHSDVNEWSTLGEDGDPITILVNGYVTTNINSLVPNVEEVNKEMSSIYLTSTQKIPLIPGVNIINPIQTSLKSINYFDSQLIANSDRITLNSKKDEILLFAKTNIELNTDNIINLNAGRYIHLHIDHKNPDSKILLGTQTDGTVPIEPVLLGNQTQIVFEQIITSLTNLASFLSSAVTTAEGTPVIACVNAGTQLSADISTLCSKIDKIHSNKVYTV
jgi:hypothetical protein